jgi:hypothetical protein
MHIPISSFNSDGCPLRTRGMLLLPKRNAVQPGQALERATTMTMWSASRGGSAFTSVGSTKAFQSRAVYELAAQTEETVVVLQKLASRLTVRLFPTNNFVHTLLIPSPCRSIRSPSSSTTGSLAVLLVAATIIVWSSAKIRDGEHGGLKLLVEGASLLKVVVLDNSRVAVCLAGVDVRNVGARRKAGM